MDLKNIPQKYRPIPFWSWNEKLNCEETKEQIRKMHDAGIGAFFMHARGGLQTEYMGEEWFQNVKASIDTAKELGMKAWAYDENGWPSGFGSGMVNGLGVEYQQKYLRYELEPVHTETQLAHIGDYYYYYEINPFYVDTLDEKVVKKFIECSYEPYFERFGNEIEGFFTDEPQISRDGIPWSFLMEDEYKKRYGDNLLEHLDALFFPVEGHEQVRFNFYKMITDLFSNAFMKQIRDWCDSHGLKLTGHLVLEDTLQWQLTSNGSAMAHYEYFHIPGMDWLGRYITDGMLQHQLASVAQQMGQKHVLSETYALCGHNVSFSELKGLFEWMMVRGVNLLCQHLEGYSLRGIRKRDYPPAMYYQQPWWSEYRAFVDAMSLEGKLLADGEIHPEVLIIHPQSSAWTQFDDYDHGEVDRLNEAFVEQFRVLEEKHVPFHFGDETVMERHAKVVGDRLEIGYQSYKYVILPEHNIFFESTKKLLEEFEKNGGIITTVEEIPENPVTDDKTLGYTVRENSEYKLHYFTNSSEEYKTAKINVRGKKVDIYSGELVPFAQNYEFEPWGSLMVIEDEACAYADEKTETPIYLDGTFKVADGTLNTMTLDFCDYYFDGELQEENGYVLNICERANKLRRGVDVHQDYFVNANYVPQTLYLVCETPEKFKIAVNGTEIDKTDLGYFRDKAFRKLDIARYMKEGKNTISFDTYFEQSARFYDDLDKAYQFESEKNKLAYDMEIEPIYLLGDFSVTTSGTWEDLPLKACRYYGDFTLDAPVKEITLKHIERQGFPFFCGELSVEGEIEICGENPVLTLDPKGVNAIRVEIGGVKRVLLTDGKLNLSDIVESGTHKIKLTLVNNLRNLMGPHHLKVGETDYAGPPSFFKEPCVWNKAPEEDWDDNYCFVETSL